MRSVLLDCPALDAYGQMALDEVLLESAPQDALTLRLYRWSGQAGTFGYFQAYEEVLRQTVRHTASGFPLVRRLTGGGIVYHDGDITFSLVFPWNHLTDASWIYKEIHRGIHLGLKARNLRSRLWSPPRREPSLPGVCFARPSPMDLVHEDGTKFLGGALRRRRGVGLYQGSMRLEGFKTASDRLAEAIINGIGEVWGADFHQEHAGAELLEDARELAERKYKTEEWNQRRQS